MSSARQRGGSSPRQDPARRRLVPAAVVTALVVTVLLLAWGGGTRRTAAPLDPDNPTADGAQAMARVLASQGVTVEVARGEPALRRAAVGAATTVFVASTVELRESTVRSLTTLTAAADRLVLLRPERRVLRQVDPEIRVRDTYRQGLVAACDTPDVRPGETLSRSQAEYLTDAAAFACFTTDGYAVLLGMPARGGHAPLLLVGSADLVTNDTVLSADNAALGLRVLGHSPRLVWYVPDLRDATASESSEPPSLAPAWFGPLVLLGGFAVLAVLLWRGRRLGRLVTEPLPVTVRAVEATESRGRLYRKARDTARAAAALRQGTRRRLAAYLQLPPGSPPAMTVTAVAAASGRPPQQVDELLYGPKPATDADLLALGGQLQALEKEVRRR